jgi:hypothetical protein
LGALAAVTLGALQLTLMKKQIAVSIKEVGDLE